MKKGLWSRGAFASAGLAGLAIISPLLASGQSAPQANGPPAPMQRA